MKLMPSISLRAWWISLRASFWFIPALMAAGAFALAVLVAGRDDLLLAMLERHVGALHDRREELLRTYDALPIAACERALDADWAPVDVLHHVAAKEAYTVDEAIRLADVRGHTWREFNSDQAEADRRLRGRPHTGIRGLGRERRAQSGLSHFLWHALLVAAGMGRMNTTTTDPLRCTARTLARTTGAFLLVGLGATTRNFAAYLGVMRAKARICHLANISLVHQIYINGGFEDRGGEFHFAKLLAFQV